MNAHDGWIYEVKTFRFEISIVFDYSLCECEWLVWYETQHYPVSTSSDLCISMILLCDILQTDRSAVESAHTNATKDSEIKKLKLELEKSHTNQRRDGKSIQELKDKIKKLELEKGELTVIRVCTFVIIIPSRIVVDQLTKLSRIVQCRLHLKPYEIFVHMHWT